MGCVTFVAVASSLPVDADTVSGNPRTVTAPTRTRPTTYVAGTGALYKQGHAAIERGDFAGAVAPLEEAIRRRPNDAQARLALAIAYSKTKQPLQGWIQIRQAVRIDPEHKNATLFLKQYWSAYDSQGVVNVGRSMRDVRSAMGRPDLRKTVGNRTRWQYGFMVIEFVGGKVVEVIDQRAKGGDRSEATERFRFQFDGRAWPEGHRGADHIQSIVEYAPLGQTVQKWTELVTTQRLYNLAAKEVSSKQFVNTMRDKLNQSGIENQWRILRDGERNVLYEWTTPGGNGREAQNEIAARRHRCQGPSPHRVHGISPKDRQKWVRLLSRAVLVEQR